MSSWFTPATVLEANLERFQRHTLRSILIIDRGPADEVTGTRSEELCHHALSSLVAVSRSGTEHTSSQPEEQIFRKIICTIGRLFIGFDVRSSHFVVVVAAAVAAPNVLSMFPHDKYLKDCQAVPFVLVVYDTHA